MAVLRKLRSTFALLALSIVTSLVWADFQNPVDVPAQPSAKANKSPLLAVVRAGKRLVAVGQRGHVIVSDDDGRTWVQGQVPVSSDLLAVHFPSPQNGWAVGQGGVVINSHDGGLTWAKQLDGKQVSKRILDYYAQAAGKDSVSNAQHYVEREKSLIAIGGTQPFMGVYFESDLRGYVVGTFNRILRTEDGGKTWEPLMHRVENPRELHLLSIAAGDSGLYMVGEAGTVWKYAKETDQFVARPVGYNGTLFGIVVGNKALIAFGMRGSVYRSESRGESWRRVELGSHAGVTGGVILDNGNIILASLAGTSFVSVDSGQSFKTFQIPGAMSFFGVVSLDEKRLALVGAEGIRLANLTELQSFKSAALVGVNARSKN